MKVYLIRHAQSTNQVLDSRDSMVFDPHLTDLGERQAMPPAEYIAAIEHRTGFADGDIDRLTCSPMWRALQTTRPLAEALGLRPEVWVDVTGVSCLSLIGERLEIRYLNRIAHLPPAHVS